MQRTLAVAILDIFDKQTELTLESFGEKEIDKIFFLVKNNFKEYHTEVIYKNAWDLINSLLKSE